jgi:ribosome recycling factor
MQWQNFFSVSEEIMKKTTDRLKTELSLLRTGRASSTVVEGIKVESYGFSMTISQIAGISVPDARTIEIKPWDISQLGLIEKAIQKTGMNMNPINDGSFIRIIVPQLTEERRKEIVKSIKKISEDFKIAIRNERRILVENIRLLEKDKIITKDDKKKFEADAQRITDGYIKKINEITIDKEKEIMKV